MPEIILARHAQAFANLRNFTAFGNFDSPLTEKGKNEQCPALKLEFENLGIVPERYELPVAVSGLTRAQETAQRVGFPLREVVPLINETETGTRELSVIELKRRHLEDGWVPEETHERVVQFIDMVRSGELPYKIFFSHGVLIATVKRELAALNNFEFHHKYGYIPAQASLTVVTI